MNSSQSNRETKAAAPREGVRAEGLSTQSSVKEPLRAPCLWRKCEHGLANNLDKDAVTPSICLHFRKSKPPVAICDEKVIPVTSCAASRVGPTLGVPIVMVINPLALSPEHSEVAFGEPERHYHATTQDLQTNSIQQGKRQQAFLWAIIILSLYLKSLDLSSESLKTLGCSFFFLLVKRK